MTPIKQESGITRRGFFKGGTGVLASAGILAAVGEAKDGTPSAKNQDSARTELALMAGKIALEEHFALPEAGDDAYNNQPTPEFRVQMHDMGSGRIAEMDRGGVELCILSHVGPGIQAIPNTSEAIATSRRWNDYLADHHKM